LDHLTDEQKPLVAKKVDAAYALEDYAEAKNALNTLHRELMDLNPSAARSLGEGLEETLTVHRVRVPPRLRKTLASANVIESAFSIVERVCANVKRWHAGDQRERWVGSGLLVAEKQFRRVQGHKQIPILLRELTGTDALRTGAKTVCGLISRLRISRPSEEESSCDAHWPDSRKSRHYPTAPPPSNQRVNVG
jgi:hypothetical protein